MNDERMAELRRLAEAAVPGPWFSTDGCCVFADGYNGIADAFALNKDHPNGETIDCPWPHEQCQTNARFIAAARTAVPELLAECERLRAERDRLAAKIASVYEIERICGLDDSCAECSAWVAIDSALSASGEKERP